MIEDTLIIMTVVLFVVIPVILGEVLDFIFRVSWSIINRTDQ